MTIPTPSCELHR